MTYRNSILEIRCSNICCPSFKVGCKTGILRGKFIVIEILLRNVVINLDPSCSYFLSDGEMKKGFQLAFSVYAGVGKCGMLILKEELRSPGNGNVSS